MDKLWTLTEVICSRVTSRPSVRMRRRVVPNAVSKRFRRKLARSKDPFLLWLRCKRPAVWARLTRLWAYRFLQMVTSIDVYSTPFVTSAPRVTIEELIQQWRLD